jgi:FlaA1/EpsC-like NDP-sugar epimerase
MRPDAFLANEAVGYSRGEIMQETLDSFRPDLFKDKCILVTGGSSWIGLAIGQGFAGLGGAVIALGNSEAKLATAKKEAANKKIRFERVDVRDPAAIKRSVRGSTGSTCSSIVPVSLDRELSSRTRPTSR